MNKVLGLLLAVVVVLGVYQPQFASADLTADSYVTITSPNGGEILHEGQTYRITWNSSNNLDTVTVGYKPYVNGVLCESCLDWVAFNAPNVGYYDWNVNVGNTYNTKFILEITAYQTGQGSVADRSDNPFTVYNHLTTPPEICNNCLRTDKTTYTVGETPTAYITGMIPNSLINWEFYQNGYLVQEAGQDYGDTTDQNGNFTDKLAQLTDDYVGNWQVYIKVGNIVGETSYTVNSKPAPPATELNIAGPQTLTGTIGQLFSYQMSVSGGKSPYTWSIGPSSNPYAGMAITSTGLLTTNGPIVSEFENTYDVTVKVTDANGVTAQRTFYFNVNKGSSSTTNAHPAGTNIKTSDGTVWFITNTNCRSAYTSAGAFLSYGFNSWALVTDANSNDLQLPVCGSNNGFTLPREGKITCSDRGSDRGTCYLISNSKKSGFTSEQVFRSLGFSFANATYADVSWMQSGPNIGDPNSAHLAGVLINNNGTIQLITNNIVVGFPDMNTFSSWGYSISDVVMANQADKLRTQTGVLGVRVAGQLNPYLSE